MSLHTLIMKRWVKPALERSCARAFVQDFIAGFEEARTESLMARGEDPGRAREQARLMAADEGVRLEAERQAAGPARQYAEEWLAAKMAEHEADQVRVCILCGASPEQQVKARAAEYARGLADGAAQERARQREGWGPDTWDTLPPPFA